MKRSQIDNLLGALVLKTHDALTSDFGGLGLRTATDAATLILLLQSDGSFHYCIGRRPGVVSFIDRPRRGSRLEKRQLVSRLRQNS